MNNLKTTPPAPTDKMSSSTNSMAMNDPTKGQISKQPALLTAQANVNNQLIAIIQHQAANLPNPLTARVTKGLAATLNNQTITLVADNQIVRVYLQSALNNQGISLSPSLAQAVRNWLQKDDKLAFKALPKALQQTLIKELSGSFKPELHSLAKLQLQNNLLSVSWFNQGPILEIALNPKPQLSNDSLQQLLQLVLPIPLQDSAKVIIREQNSSTSSVNNFDGGLNFEMAFDLTPLGKLTATVWLKNLEIKANLACSNRNIEQNVERHWPQLQARFERFGFRCKLSVELAPEVQATDEKGHAGLINIKV